MSLAATIQAYATRTDPVAKLALIEIADWADDEGRAPLVVSQIADFAGCSEVDVENAVARLIKRGVLSELPTDARGRRFVLFEGIAA